MTAPNVRLPGRISEAQAKEVYILPQANEEEFKELKERRPEFNWLLENELKGFVEGEGSREMVLVLAPSLGRARQAWTTLKENEIQEAEVLNCSTDSTERPWENWRAIRLPGEREVKPIDYIINICLLYTSPSPRD